MTVTKTTRAADADTARLWWRIVRGTWRGTRVLFRNIWIDTRFTYGKTKTRLQAEFKAWKAERQFKPDEIDFIGVDEVPRRRRRLFRAQYVCFACNRKFKSSYGLNKHFTGSHGAEPLPKNRDHAVVVGRGGTSKVWFRPSRSSSNTTARTTTIARSANPMNSAAAQALKAAWGRLRESKPTKLSEIRDDMIGLEQAMGAYATEAIEEYRAHLIRNLNVDPYTVRNLQEAARQLEEAGRAFSAVIAVIEEFYAADIVAARQRLNGARPADSTLAK